MGSFKTHLLIGASGGIALGRLLDSALMPVPAGMTGALPVAGKEGDLRGALALAGLVLGSAVLATWCDVDEPGSWIARRSRAALTMLGAVLGGAVAWLEAARRVPETPRTAVEVAALLGIIAGAMAGTVAGHLGFRVLRRAAGGHRRLTHSLVLGALLGLGALLLWRTEARVWAAIPAALLWGQVLHLLGDVVTPAGVPLLWPLSDRDLGLPRPIARFGEPLIAGLAVVAGVWMLLAP